MKIEKRKVQKMISQEVEETIYISEDGTIFKSEKDAIARDNLLKLMKEYKFKELYLDGEVRYFGYFDSFENTISFLKGKFGHIGSVSTDRNELDFPSWLMINVDDSCDYTYTYISSYKEIIDSIEESEREINEIKKFIGL